ncbi:MAG: MarR family transcriptional regulator [Myxococcota bacterium]
MPQSRAQKREPHRDVESTSPYDDLVCFNFYRGWRSIQEYYAPAFPPGYSPQRGYVVGLCLNAPTTVSAIAAALQIDDASVSNMVRRMEADGLLRKVRSQEDGRSVEIVATERARKMERKTRRALAKLDDKLAKEVSPQQLKSLKAVAEALHKVNRARDA